MIRTSPGGLAVLAVLALAPAGPRAAAAPAPTPHVAPAPLPPERTASGPTLIASVPPVGAKPVTDGSGAVTLTAARPASPDAPAGAALLPVAIPLPAAPPQRRDGSDADAAGERAVRPKARSTLPLEVSLGGRVYVGLDVDERTGWTRDVGLADARVTLEARLPSLLTVVEADLSSDDPLRDAFIRFEGAPWARLQAGRFKAPFSHRRLESSWTLPLVRRGLVDRYVVEGSDLGGRRLGAVGELRPLGGRVGLVAGLFSGPSATEDGPPRQDLSAAVTVRPWRQAEAGLTGYRASGEDELLHATSAYLDASLGPAQVAVEGMAGRVEQGAFVAGTALLSLSYRVAKGLRVGPVIGAEGLRLREGDGGVGWAATAGAVLARAEGFKVKLEGERARRPGDEVPANAIALQLATRF